MLGRENGFSYNVVITIPRRTSDSNGVGVRRRQTHPGRPEGLRRSQKKKSEIALTGLETSDISFVRHSSRDLLLIANKLASDF